MKSENVVAAIVLGLSLLHGTGHGHLFYQLMDYLGQHSTVVSVVVLVPAAVLLFIAWLMVEKDKMDREESDL